MNDGNFGSTGDCKEINAEEELIESHNFEEIQSLLEKPNLNFNNPIQLNH